MKNLQKLFEMSPAIRKIIGENSNPTNRNKKLMELFAKEFDDFDSELHKALEAYSKQGFFASPQVNSKKEYSERFFDWEIVNLVRRTNISPSNHQLISLDTSVFFIQYLISGGFKNPEIPFTNEAVSSEFDESFVYINTNK
ncbi:hypothetical protein BL02_81 [Klebsiella phage BL02]|jgi:hypothetical protein|uniref:Uncharacterized protein n=2 Tax=Viruses TaxID=10239 RepID=K7NPQ6_9CAUD|nr:hypothetical protein KP27_091 [Klebsiella phage KP27]MBG2194799.1 hypothetical protein [Klebsiella pneumoniae]URQ04334.1 hypothetical protein BL02_81 [Klebsiella phage BL02]WDQ26356.1 hypothetical protein phiKPNS3_00090 [Klebsiella phage phi_KPN_S3]WMX18163.1 hypothetical protein [Klebsiella phage KpF2]CAD5241632.1 hypothetical protein IPGJFKPH_00080 [Klebsiella phage vB_KoM-Pickle]CAD5241682.1 hypothetical protein GCLPFEGH_00085 [Klebsiella phage vB_KpM-KalD]CAD5242661.1 hypothetical pro